MRHFHYTERKQTLETWFQTGLEKKKQQKNKKKTKKKTNKQTKNKKTKQKKKNNKNKHNNKKWNFILFMKFDVFWHFSQNFISPIWDG